MVNFYRKYNSLIFGFIILSLVCFSYLSYREKTNTTYELPLSIDKDFEYTVTFTENGFVPEKISIYEGQLVKFITNTDKDFWPASNLHPSHNLFPEFDPKSPVSRDKSWSFKFEDSGEYRYHDHLYPSYKGMIKVFSYDGKIQDSMTDKCSLKGDSNDSRCWDILIQRGWEEDSIKGAFAVISYLYANEPEFLKHDDCHRHAHSVGDMSVKYFLDDVDNYKKWNFPREAVSCGYGFFHGLFEHLFRDIKDLNLSINICQSLTERLSSTIPSIRKNCYHGMGHGFMPDQPPKDDWGNFSVVNQPLKRCDYISKNEEEIKECYQGVFNVLADWMTFNNFGFSNDKKDPFSACKLQENLEHKKACYYEFAMRTPSYTENSLTEVVNRFIEGIEDDFLAKMIINSAAATLMEKDVTHEEFLSFFEECSSFEERIKKECFSGLIGGQMAHGEPEKEYIKILNLCKSDKLDLEEEKDCYNFLSRKLLGVYNIYKSREICRQMENPDSKEFCLNLIK